MSEVGNVKESFENVNDNFETDLKMKKLKEELAKSFAQYQTTMKYLAADAPIAILCLPSVIEKILLDNGCVRVYDIFNMDLAEVKGLGSVRIRDLTTSLNQFFSML
jgi:hypothetical protein